MSLRRLARGCLLLAAACASGELARPPETAAERLEVGRRVYLDGLLASGEPVRAVVAGDVPVAGNQFTCVSCHQRSGMGSSEGWLTASVVTEQVLYAPRVTGRRQRPAYTDASLARTLRTAVDPAGNAFGAAMPRYDLPDLEMRGLLAYLRTLSSGPSPGVTETDLHFATVVAGDVEAGPMLALLQRFFEERNRQTRHEPARRRSGAFYRANVDRSYRVWNLHVWRLDGAPASWRQQLEAHQARRPVFALLSGMAAGPWEPVHAFCEEQRIPCLLPNTDRPPERPGDYYSLYFSRGLALEALAVARHLQASGGPAALVQVYRRGGAGEEAARVLRGERGAAGFAAPLDLVWGADEAAPPALPAAEGRPAVLILWLDAADLQAVAGHGPATGPVYLSSSLLDGDLSLLPEALRDTAHVAHPFSLPGPFDAAWRRVAAWLRHRGLPEEPRRLLAQTYFACMLAGEAKMHIKFDHYYRDYFLEAIDHMNALGRYSVAHPAPSFGPGQRHLSKGCYILPPAGGEPEWIVP